MRAVRRPVLVLVAIAMLAGCRLVRAPIPDPISLHSTWYNEQTDAKLVVLIDGILDYENLPLSVIDGNESHTDVLSGRGRWQLGDGLYLRDASGRPSVTLELPTEPGTAEFWTLTVLGSGQNISLMADLPGSDEFIFLGEDCQTDARAG